MTDEHRQSPRGAETSGCSFARVADGLQICVLHVNEPDQASHVERQHEVRAEVRHYHKAVYLTLALV